MAASALRALRDFQNRISGVLTDTVVPANLLERMEQEGAQSAILYTFGSTEVETPILEACRAGKRIVVITTILPDINERRMCDRLENADAIIIPESPLCIEHALNQLFKNSDDV